MELMVVGEVVVAVVCWWWLLDELEGRKWQWVEESLEAM